MDPGLTYLRFIIVYTRTKIPKINGYMSVFIILYVCPTIRAFFYLRTQLWGPAQLKYEKDSSAKYFRKLMVSLCAYTISARYMRGGLYEKNKYEEQ